MQDCLAYIAEYLKETYTVSSVILITEYLSIKCPSQHVVARIFASIDNTITIECRNKENNRKYLTIDKYKRLTLQLEDPEMFNKLNEFLTKSQSLSWDD